MTPFKFRFGTHDAFGCTVIDAKAFHALRLCYHDSIDVTRVNGTSYTTHAIRCRTDGKTHYAIDLSDMHIPFGAMVTLRPNSTRNSVILTAVESPLQWSRSKRSLMDSIAELQFTVDELKAAKRKI